VATRIPLSLNLRALGWLPWYSGTRWLSIRHLLNPLRNFYTVICPCGIPVCRENERKASGYPGHYRRSWLPATLSVAPTSYRAVHRPEGDLHPQLAATLNLSPGLGQDLSLLGTYFHYMTPSSNLAPHLLVAEERFAAFRRRLAGMTTEKLGRTLETCRGLIAIYVRDNVDRRSPGSFLEVKQMAERELEAVEGKVRYRELGPDGPFR
jgi:hypothetical protein